jgi:hypothetical protein
MLAYPKPSSYQNELIVEHIYCEESYHTEIFGNEFPPFEKIGLYGFNAIGWEYDFFPLSQCTLGLDH